MRCCHAADANTAAENMCKMDMQYGKHYPFLVPAIQNITHARCDNVNLTSCIK